MQIAIAIIINNLLGLGGWYSSEGWYINLILLLYFRL